MIEREEIQRIQNPKGGGSGSEPARPGDELNEMRNRLSAELDAMIILQRIGALCAKPGADFSTCLGKILDAALALLGGTKGNIQIVDEATGALRIAVHRGLGKQFREHFASVVEDSSSCGAAMGSGHRVVVEDVTTSPLFASGPGLEVLRNEGIFAVQSTPLTSSTGRILGMISTHHEVPRRFTDSELRRIDILARQAADFVERKRSDQALRELARERQSLLEAEQAARREAERASRLKDDFMATLSHELRTPVHAILGWAQILQRRQEPEELRYGLETIERNCRAQTQLLSDLLDMSRIISGKLRLEVQQLDLPGLLDVTLETMRPAAEAKGIRLVKELDPLAGPQVLGDAGRLQQVVLNLLGNAVKFTPSGGTIRVSLARRDAHLELVVEDSGDGIGAEFLPYLFERFRQADASASRRQGGLGLGLAIVRSIVEAHGGSVRAHSDGEGKGSTFAVFLPLITPLRQEPAPVPAEPRPMVAAEMDLNGVHALVVDDDADARVLVGRILEGAGARVSMAGSADEALTSLGSELPDVLVSDLGMPGKNGFDLIRAVRQEQPASRLPAIALTALARAEDRARAMLSGYQVHLSKPVEAVELCGVVTRLCGRGGRRF